MNEWCHVLSYDVSSNKKVTINVGGWWRIDNKVLGTNLVYANKHEELPFLKINDGVSGVHKIIEFAIC